jgi:hypothetical protein
MPRPPRTDLERARDFNAKVIPSQVEAVLTTRLPGMQPAFATWASRQADLLALMAGVLSGYSVPSYQYSRYYAFGYQCDKIQRRFGAALTGTAEMLNAENVWIARGYNIVILDAIRTSVSAFGSYWSLVSNYNADMLAVNTITGHACYSGISNIGVPTHFLNFIDPATRLETSIAGFADGNTPGSHIAVCPELSTAFICEASGDVVARCNELTLTVDEQALTSGDTPTYIDIDYDIVKYGGTIKGYAAVACAGHAKLYLLQLAGAIAPVAITLPHIANGVVVDKTNNCYWVTAEGFVDLYKVDRTTHAVTTITIAHACILVWLDSTNNELWLSGGSIAGGPTNFVHLRHIAAGTWTVFAAADGVNAPQPELAIDPIRGYCYVSQIGVPNILKLSRAGGAGTTLVCTAYATPMQIDPVGCFLIWTDAANGDVTRQHLVSGYRQVYPFGSRGSHTCINPTNHTTWVGNYNPGVDKHVFALYP